MRRLLPLIALVAVLAACTDDDIEPVETGLPASITEASTETSSDEVTDASSAIDDTPATDPAGTLAEALAVVGEQTELSYELVATTGDATSAQTYTVDAAFDLAGERSELAVTFPGGDLAVAVEGGVAYLQGDAIAQAFQIETTWASVDASRLADVGALRIPGFDVDEPAWVATADLVSGAAITAGGRDVVGGQQLDLVLAAVPTAGAPAGTTLSMVTDGTLDLTYAIDPDGVLRVVSFSELLLLPGATATAAVPVAVTIELDPSPAGPSGDLPDPSAVTDVTDRLATA
jgi:hypothetical protein